MAGNRSGRSREAGDRNRVQRQQARRLQQRQDFWDVPDDSGRPHRRSRGARQFRGRSQ